LQGLQVKDKLKVNKANETNRVRRGRAHMTIKYEVTMIAFSCMGRTYSNYIMFN